MRTLFLAILLAQCSAHAASINLSLSSLDNRTEIEALKQLFPETIIENGESLSPREYASELYTRKREDIIDQLNKGFKGYEEGDRIAYQKLDKDIPNAFRLRRQHQLVSSPCECSESCLPTPRCYAGTLVASGAICAVLAAPLSIIPYCLESKSSADVFFGSLLSGLTIASAGMCCTPQIYKQCCMPCVLPEIEQPTQQVMNLPAEETYYSLLNRTSVDEEEQL